MIRAQTNALRHFQLRESIGFPHIGVPSHDQQTVHDQMARGIKIPAAVHWIVVWLSLLLSAEDIAIYTGILLRSVERILQFFKIHGTIDHKSEERKRRCQYLRDYAEIWTLRYLESFLIWSPCLSHVPVPVRCCQADSRHVPWRTARNALSSLWVECLTIDCLACASKGGIYSQKGVYSKFIIDQCRLGQCRYQKPPLNVQPKSGSIT